MPTTHLARTLFCLLLICLSSAALGQSADEPVALSAALPTVEVTARKFEEDPFELPQSITLIPESLIEDAGLERIRDAMIYVPNLNLIEFTARRLSFPFLRGIGSGQGESAVTTYLDGVPVLFNGGANFPLVNTERIEFLRGPQGTLYGRNALGGLIHVISRKPPTSPEFRAEATVGNYGHRALSLHFGAPLVEDRLSMSLSGLLHRRDGFTKNDYTGNLVDDRETYFGQAQVLWTPDDRNELRFSFLGDKTRDGGFVLNDLDGLRDRPRRINQDYEGETRRDVYLPALTWTHAGDGFDLTSITSYQHQEVRDTSDFDFSVLDGVRRTTEESLGALLQELRVSSPADAALELGPGADLVWQAGFLAFTSDSDRSAANDLRPGGVGILFPVAGVDKSSGDFTDRGIGIFGHATLTLDGQVDLGAGLRYDYEKKWASLDRTFDSGGYRLSSTSERFDEDYSELLPRFDVAWRATGEVMLYGLAARAFKAGGFNLDAPPGLIPFKPETSWTLEGGVKTSLFGDRLRMNAAYFHIDWDRMQLAQFDSQLGGYVTNAGESTSRGVEIEVTGRPLTGLDLFATLGAVDTEFDSYVDPYGVEVKGNDLPFAPKTTFSAGARLSGHLFDGVSYSLGGEYASVGSYFYDAGNLEDAHYGVANFRVGLFGATWRIQGYVRNAFARNYVPLAFQPSPMDPSVFVGESGAPRTYGVSFTLTF
jgi:iron complex outermembrane recepter protein